MASDIGLPAIRAQIARQAEDARISFFGAGGVAADVASSARRTSRLVLAGIGGSHAVNRVAEPLYRQAGIDATSVPVSELLHAPLPLGARTMLLASQSGESGEIVRYLETSVAGGSASASH